MRKRNIALWALTSVAVALVLSGCGSGSDNDLAVDNNAQSCSVVSSSGSAVVVGSGVAGDPASPEAASGGEIGLVQDGDRIEIDIGARSMHLAVSGDELARRRAEMDKRGIRYSFSNEAEDDRVLGERSQIRQVLLNLGLNAMDAMPQGHFPRARRSATGSGRPRAASSQRRVT